jgi:carboxylesterase
MRYRRIPRDTRVGELGRRIDLRGGSSAVLALHGWTGWPGRLAYLAERLNDAGFTVSVPRLPGHGTNVGDMLQTRARDWVRCAVDEYLDLCDQHERVFVVGTSMGALLASMLAAHFDAERIALLAPAFTNRNRLILLAPFVTRIVPRIRGDWREEQETDPRAVALAREYSTYNYTRMAAELLKLQRAGRRILPELTAETLVVVSTADPAVPQSVVKLIESRSCARRFEAVVVERSNHQLAEHVDRETVAGAVVDWFTRDGSA